MQILKSRKYILITILVITLSATLALTCFDATRDNPFDPLNRKNVFNANYYVSAARGADSNPGIATAPVATIMAAILKSAPGDIIAVEAGTYNNGGADIGLAGRRLIGGFLNNGLWSESARSVDNPTIVNDSRTSGGSGTAPLCTFRIDGMIGYPTVIDGFKINGGSGDYTCAIRINTDLVDGYIAKIRNNKIFGGNAAMICRGINLYNNAVNAGSYDIEIAANSIDGGTVGPANTVYSEGIFLYNNVADAIIVNIWNNTINGGEAISTNTTYTYGIFCYSLSPKIYNNTISGGKSWGTISSYNYGIFLNNFSSPEIINNIIFTDNGTTKYGIYEGDAGSDPTAVNNNNVFDTTTALYYDENTTVLTTITSGAFGGIIGVNNITTGPNFVDRPNGNWHLTATTPASVYEGGSTITDVNFPKNTTGNPIDKDGNPRTTPWSMGAYERD
jgi:hypothetical protein